MNNPLKVLIIDDDKVDAITIVRSIKKSDIIADMDSAYSEKRVLKNWHYNPMISFS